MISRKKMVYCAGPISLGDQEANVRTAMEVARKVRDCGCLAFVPHLSWFLQWNDIGLDEWLDMDFRIIGRCDAVLRLPGESRGADEEVRFAVENAIPVFESLPSLKVWLDRFRDVVPAESCCANGRPRREIEQVKEALDAHAATERWHEAEQCEPERLIGKLHHFSTGARRSADCEAVRYDLISPIGMRRLAETYAEGCAKYPPDPDTHRQNWTKGMPVSSLLNHVIRHIYRYLEGESEEDELSHATWGLLAVMHMEETMPEMVDIYERRRLQGKSRLTTNDLPELAGQVT